jgi:SAM-dependent methyltransferase
MPRLSGHELTFSRRWRETFGRVDSAQTAAEAAFLRRVLPLPEFRRVLDVPCGFGRHMAFLCDSGYDVVGIDNDPVVVDEAQAAGLDARLGDMCDLSHLRDDFDAVICMWTSFGYFDVDTNAEVLRGFASRVRSGGRIVLDLLDPAFFESRQGERDNNGVRDRKTIVDGRIRTELEYPGGERDVFEWQLYTPQELALLAGVELVLTCAAFDESAPPRGEAPRMQVVLATSG